VPHYRAGYLGDPKNVAPARKAIASFAAVCGFDEDAINDIRIAAGEALSNAVEHGRSIRSSGFSVSCSFEDDEIRIDIRDNGTGFIGDVRNDVPIEERNRGFGIFIMRRLMDGVHYDHNGTAVRLSRRKETADQS
jgi:serine/threonine-protein kinase RsbW